MLCVEESQVFCSTIEVLLLAPAPALSQPQKGKGLVNCVYTSHVPLHFTVRYNHIAVFYQMMHYTV